MDSYKDTPSSRVIAAPAKYEFLTGDATRAYTALCRVLCGSGDRVDWASFSEADWSLVLDMAIKERVAPLLHGLSRSEGYDRIFPSEVRDGLSQAYYETVACNAIYFKRFRQIATALSDRRIPVIPIKGGELARRLYPKVGFRPMRDLDILVRRESLEEARAVVTQLGFHEKEPEMAFNRLAGHHLTLCGGDTGCEAVEIHWTVGDVGKNLQPRLEKWLWEQASRFAWEPGLSAADALVFSLSPTATLLSLAAHQGEQHRMRHLLWIYDLHLLISKEGSFIDWGELAARAEEFGWLSALRVSLADCQYHFGTSLPGGLLSVLSPGAPGRAVHQLQNVEISNPRPVFVLRTLARLPWRDRFRLFRLSVFPGRQWMIMRYRPDPPWLWPLFYLVRWFRFGWQSIRNARHLLRECRSSRN